MCDKAAAKYLLLNYDHNGEVVRVMTQHAMMDITWECLACVLTQAGVLAFFFFFFILC